MNRRQSLLWTLLLGSEVKRWGAVIKAAKIEPE